MANPQKITLNNMLGFVFIGNKKQPAMSLGELRTFLIKKKLKINDLDDGSLFNKKKIIDYYFVTQFFHDTNDGNFDKNREILSILFYQLPVIKNFNQDTFLKYVIEKEQELIFRDLNKVSEALPVDTPPEEAKQAVAVEFQERLNNSSLNSQESAFLSLATDVLIAIIMKIGTLKDDLEALLNESAAADDDTKIQLGLNVEMYVLKQVQAVFTLGNYLFEFKEPVEK